MLNRFVAAPVVLLVLMPSAALAQDGTIVDFSGTLTTLVEILAAIAIPVAMWGVKRAADWLGVQMDSTKEAILNETVVRAVAYGRSQANAAAKKHGKIDMHNETVAYGTRYLQDQMPRYLKDFGYDAGKARERVEAYLAGLDAREIHTAR